jgi:hypothetical protein
MAVDPATATGKLANAVEQFANDLLQEVGPDDERGTVDEFVDFLTTSPNGGAYADIKLLNLLQRMGEWQHPDRDIQDHIQAQWAQMDGSLHIAYAEMGTAPMVGWASLERAIRDPQESGYQDGYWWLESLQLIPPKRHNFEGSRGKIASVRYYPDNAPDFSIPYERIVHVVNRRHVAALTDRPMYGVADCRLAYAAHKAWKIVINEALVAGQRQATPIIVGLADDSSQVPLYDDRGVPLRDANNQIIAVPAPEKLKRELQSLNSNGGVITAGLTSEIQALNQQTDGRFFMELLHYLDRLMARAFLVPFTVLDEGVAGLGNAGLAQEQLNNMRLMLDTIAEQIQDELLEKVIRPLIVWNFGEQETYGSWLPPEEQDQDRIDLLDSLTRGFASGLYSTTDLDFVNRHRELAGIPPTEELATALSKPHRYWRDAA